MPAIRTERTYGVTASLDNTARSQLAELLNSDGWPVLLDVMEQTVIEMETDLINTPVSESGAILAKHAKVQAAWQVFTHMQKKSHDEVVEFLRETTVVQPPVSQEDADILQTTEPFNEYGMQATPD